MPFPTPFGPRRIREEFLSAEQLLAGCGVVWSRDARAAAPAAGKINAGDLVYAKIDDVSRLFERLRLSRNRIILLTAEGDRPVDTALAQWLPPQVAEWFSTNVLVTDPRIHSIPLGLANSYCEITLKPDLLAACAPTSVDRTRWLYVNFRTQTNPAVRQPTMEYFRRFSEKPWITIDEGRTELGVFQRELRDHYFAVCPPGNGIDTHRMWEALYCGTIPIVLRSPAMDAFSDLPIFMVESYQDITLSTLKSAYERIASSSWNYEKLFVPWWSARIAAAKQRLMTGDARIPPMEFLKESARFGIGALRRRM